jgi:hypothetical protein
VSKHPNASRRQLLAGVVGGTTVSGAVMGADPARATAAPGAPSGMNWAGARSQNGWSLVSPGQVRRLVVEGSDAAVALLPGDVSVILMHVARRFHYEVSTLRGGDVHGHVTGRGLAAPDESNYLSGTAIAIRPGQFPAGSGGNLFRPQLIVVRDVLAECAGVVRWGGDDRRPKEGHFQIDVPPGDPGLRRVAARITAWREARGRGAGTPIDSTDPARRRAAVALQRRQRTPRPDHRST